MSAVEEIRNRVNKNGLGESIVDYYGRNLAIGAEGRKLPASLVIAWREAYDAMQKVNDLLEELGDAGPA